MNKQLNNLEVIAEMANLKLGSTVFREHDETVINFTHHFNSSEIQLTEDIEKKIYIIDCDGKKETRYSNQEAVDLLIKLYTAPNEN
jgi:hypothetical protein